MSAGNDDLDFSDAFSAHAIPLPTLNTSSEAEKREVTIVADTLRETGYHVNIARKARKVAPLTSKYSILCIEDDPGLLRALAKKLALDGYAVRTASDRKTILAELRRPPPPHLILLDVALPDISGFDILHKLRQHPKLGSIPVIMLTAKSSLEDVLRGMKGGADGYVSKPFRFDALTVAIQTVLGIR